MPANLPKKMIGSKGFSTALEVATESTGKPGRPRKLDHDGDTGIRELFAFCKTVYEQQQGYEASDNEFGKAMLDLDRKSIHQFRYGTMRIDKLLQLNQISQRLDVDIEILLKIVRYEWNAKTALHFWLHPERRRHISETIRVGTTTIELSGMIEPNTNLAEKLRQALPELIEHARQDAIYNTDVYNTKWAAQGANRPSDLKALRRGKRSVLSAATYSILHEDYEA